MSVWLSWANQATSMWTTAAMTAAKRNQAAALKAMLTPPKTRGAGKGTATSRRKKPSR
ncbi:hypothetical protein [Azospirillum sp. TSO35-2]|uniref:hypothetical protein n=1 Tax=Azospirillum sp. TSO35-2 TaxID=716796 RepID=UPI0018EE575B|nr:hypothetical protein [Azospirillum sp. TSO35-2]